MEAVLPIVIQAMSLIPGLVAAGIEIVTLVESTVKALQSGSTNPSDEVWMAVDAQIAANTAKLNADPA